MEESLIPEGKRKAFYPHKLFMFVESVTVCLQGDVALFCFLGEYQKFMDDWRKNEFLKSSFFMQEWENHSFFV